MTNYLQMANPSTGNTAEATSQAFEGTYRGRGWILLKEEDPDPQVPLEAPTGQAANTDGRTQEA